MRVKKVCCLMLWTVLFSSVLFATPTYAADGSLFSDLIRTGAEIFNGVRDIVYIVAGFGIIGVAVGGFFGNINWKWLSAIIIGLMVIGLTGGLLRYISGSSVAGITDTLK